VVLVLAAVLVVAALQVLVSPAFSVALKGKLTAEPVAVALSEMVCITESTKMNKVEPRLGEVGVVPVSRVERFPSAGPSGHTPAHES